MERAHELVGVVVAGLHLAEVVSEVLLGLAGVVLVAARLLQGGPDV